MLMRMVRGLNHLRSQIEPKLAIRIERGNYIVKTVSEAWEFQEVLRLRYDVFHREYRKAVLPVGWDLDDYDFICDHLIIIKKDEAEKEEGKRGTIVGTYRMIASTFSDKFYSQSEFHLDEFLKEPGVKLELGRACIHPDFRKGSVMSLLWRGVTEYMRLTQARYLFGCSSIKVMETEPVSQIYQYLEGKNFLVEEYGIHPLDNWEVPGLIESLAKAAAVEAAGQTEAGQAVMSEEEAKALLPPLLEMYLLAGAKVIGRPALDTDFNCVDFLTVLDTTKLSQLFSRRYQTS